MKEVERAEGKIISLHRRDSHDRRRGRRGRRDGRIEHAQARARARRTPRDRRDHPARISKAYRERPGAFSVAFSPSMSTSRTSRMRSRSCAGSRKNTNSIMACASPTSAIVEAVHLSARYITDRFLPDKAIDLIDEASSACASRLKTSRLRSKTRTAKLCGSKLKRRLCAKRPPTPKPARPKTALKNIERKSPSFKKRPANSRLSWKNEKQVLSDIKSIKKELESLRIEAENAEASVDLSPRGRNPLRRNPFA